MSPKEKANAIVRKHWEISRNSEYSYDIAIKNAKVAVDEIMDEVIHLQEENEGVYGTRELFDRHIFWENVKNELEKL